MGHFEKDSTPAASCDALLVKANRIYQEIGALYQSMHNDLSAASTLHLVQTVNTLNNLLKDAQTVDSLVADSLRTVSTLSEATGALIRQRETTLEKLYQDNQKIADKAKNVQSLLRHEIISMSTNRNAIKGYKPAGEEKKYLLRDSF